MSISTHIKGVRDLDGEFLKMVKVKEACEEASIDYPEEVKKYFKYPKERVEYLKKLMEEIDITLSVSQKVDDYCDIFEVDLSRLPKEVKLIRFVNSY